MSQALDILERHKSLAARRDLWKPLWQELSDLLYPNRGGFTMPIVPGQENMTELYDSTPMQARRGLATAIDSLVKPSTSRWFWMKSQNDQINDDEQAKAWFDVVCDRMWSALYDPMARFVQHSTAVDNDLAAFGLGYLWCGENRNRDGLIFRSLHVGDCAIDENADGQVDTVYIVRRFTARQAKQRFGDKTPAKINEALTQGNSVNNANTTKLYEFVQAIYPREDRDLRRADNLNFPFANCIVSVEGEEIVEESGFQEFPVAIPRWEVAPGEIYPRSPGMIGLPDSRTLQAMGRTLLVGGQRAVDPPVWVVDDAVLSAVRTFPGGLTVVDAEAVKATGGKPMGHLDMGANIPIGREMQHDYRELVGAAFFKQVFSLPTKPDMTATEVMERKEEFLRTIGPTLGQLENDYIGVIIRRVFGLMLRANAFPTPPDILQNRNVNFEFMSPIQQAKRQVETASMARAFQFMEPIVQLQPQIADNIDGDAIVRDAPDIFGVPQKWIKPLQVRDAERQQKQQALAAQQALEQGQQGAGIVKQLVDAHVAHQGAQQQQPVA